MVLSTLLDLVLPTECAGCGEPCGLSGVCSACLATLRQTAYPTRPVPEPDGLPMCLTGAEYGGVVRELIVAYKERGRRGLAAPLGDALAVVVRYGLERPRPLVLAPVPTTAAAARARNGDHMWRLARRVARRLRLYGCPVRLAAPVRARPKADSTHLDRMARARAARAAFAVRARRVPAVRAVAQAGAAVVLLDDVLTTGATLAAVATRLGEAGIPVAFAATLAATRLRRRGPLGP
jgi:predicted amidophosphoribosyltransferase